MALHFDLPYEIPYLLSDRRIDPHHWMKDNKVEFSISSSKTSENTRNFLNPLNNVIDSLVNEMESKVDLEFSSPKKHIGDYVYYSEYENNDNYPTYYRKKIGLESREKLCKWDSLTVLNYIPSPNGRYILFVLDDKGTQFGDIVLFDCQNHSITYHRVNSANNGNVVWNDKSNAYWYVKANSLKRTDKIFYHKINESDSDIIVYQEKDIRYEVEIIKDPTSVYISSFSIDNSELIRINGQNGQLEIFIPRHKNLLAKLIPSSDNTFLLIHKGTDNGALYQLQKNLNYTLIFRSENDYLMNIIPLKDFFILETREKGLPAISLLTKNDLSLKKVEIPLGKIDIMEYDYDKCTFSLLHSSPVQSPHLYHFDCKSNQFDMPFKEVDQGFEISQQFAISDGVEIPITLVHKKGVNRDGQNPLLIYAYGAYGSVIDPSFCKPYSSLLQRGVILAYAHVRGGGEFGRIWHVGSKKQKKITSFKDLIACAEYLIDNGYSTPKKMGLQGASAGGTLAAGIINMRPDLFKVVLLEMPFVDAISDLNDPSVPYTPQEWEEWGNPQNSEELRSIKEWSPIDNITSGFKPAVYITAGENDVQVLSDEPYKFWAKLKKNQMGTNPILFEMMKGGHKGDTGRYSSIRQIAPMYAFLLDQLGIQR